MLLNNDTARGLDYRYSTVTIVVYMVSSIYLLISIMVSYGTTAIVLPYLIAAELIQIQSIAYAAKHEWITGQNIVSIIMLLLSSVVIMYSNVYYAAKIMAVVIFIICTTIVAISLAVSIRIIAAAISGIKRRIKPYYGVIILGTSTCAGLPGKELEKRLKAAKQVYSSSQDTIFIVSGGCTSGDSVSEAYVMREYLINAEIDKSLIYADDTSVNTLQNIEHSIEIMPDNVSRVYILSSWYHLYRVSIIARRLGIRYTPISVPVCISIQELGREIINILLELFVYN